METHLFWGQKVKDQDNEATKTAGVGSCTPVSVRFFYTYVVIGSARLQTV